MQCRHENTYIPCPLERIHIMINYRYSFEKLNDLHSQVLKY